MRGVSVRIAVLQVVPKHIQRLIRRHQLHQVFLHDATLHVLLFLELRRQKQMLANHEVSEVALAEQVVIPLGNLLKNGRLIIILNARNLQHRVNFSFGFHAWYIIEPHLLRPSPHYLDCLVWIFLLQLIKIGIIDLVCRCWRFLSLG